MAIPELTKEKVLSLVREDQMSRRKRKARVADRYYDGKHDILRHRIFYFNKDGKLVEDVFKSNTRISHPFFTELVEQEVQYLFSGGIEWDVQDQDLTTKTVLPEMCVTETKPEDADMADLDFAWHIVKHVKSNAIVVVKNGMTLGVGAGQMNRIGSAEIALKEAEAAFAAKGEDVKKAGLIMASDGFFPFDDCVSLAAEYGVKAIVQPGGSIRDNDSIVKANEHGIAMLFTGMRHFKH